MYALIDISNQMLEHIAALRDAAILAAAPEQVIKARRLDPSMDCLTRRCGDLELYWPVRLLLHDDRTRTHTLAVTNVSNAQPDEVACSELAVDC